MTKSQPLHIVACSLIAAVCLAPSALAAASAPAGQGEPKNTSPFTAPYRAPGTSVRYTTATPLSPMPQGEAKNAMPFRTTYNEDPGLARAYAKIATLETQVTGEAKNTPPFTDSVGSPRSGFDWIEVSLVALGALGAFLVLAGAIALRRRTSVELRAVRVEHA
jgi:hypothetical protein